MQWERRRPLDAGDSSEDDLGAGGGCGSWPADAASRLSNVGQGVRGTSAGSASRVLSGAFGALRDSGDRWNVLVRPIDRLDGRMGE